MSRLSRINTIWLKEARDTLRDHRTVLAMVLLPIVLYPALMLGSLQAFEYQTSRLRQETFTVGVQNEAVGRWLRQLIDTDLARRKGAPGVAAEELSGLDEQPETHDATSRPVKPPLTTRERENEAVAAARQNVYERPPKYEIVVIPDLGRAIREGAVHVGITMEGRPPTADDQESLAVTMFVDETDFRAQMAQTGLAGIFARKAEALTEQRLRKLGLARAYIEPLKIASSNIASPEKSGVSVIAQIVPLILIMMTITGAIYPAIDLTAGERERGTLETLMVAPVSSVDLILGKFIVVAIVGMLSALLNLLAIGGTIFLSGVGDSLLNGNKLTIPLHVLPWIFVIILPLAMLFSATLLAVCSFARSFKEAQNYLMPVIVAAMIPALVGVLPGVRLEGPLLVIPVTNIVLLTRDLFLGAPTVWANIIWVFASTSLYAAAAVAIAARLFGQEAVLFNDNSSAKTLFMRRFFKPREYPTIAQALLLVTLVYSLNFFVQQAVLRSSGGTLSLPFFYSVAAIMLIFFAALPLATALYLKLRVSSTFALEFPPPQGWLAGLLIGSGTWILAIAWGAIQSRYLPLPPELTELNRDIPSISNAPWQMLFLAAMIPGVCEELFFRGFALAGLRTAIGGVAAVVVSSMAFSLNHHMVQRLAPTFVLGLLLGVLVVRYRSIFPAMVAHIAHNGFAVALTFEQLTKGWFRERGLSIEKPEDMPPTAWLIAAAASVGLGLMITFVSRPRSAAAAAGGELKRGAASASLPALDSA
ncbi:MAG: ABC transporter permease subunit/CPBP intramembrane protease [Phycisphaerae bacterium]|nr:ABC transporter permease subunit/CPBP intramembrane protease [Phycisphaerae bacterium]